MVRKCSLKKILPYADKCRMVSQTSTTKGFHVMVIAGVIPKAIGLQNWLATHLPSEISKISIAYGFDDGKKIYEMDHPDLILISKESNAGAVIQFARTIRTLDGKRHIGLVVYSEEEILDDEFVVKCLDAGIDDCIASYLNPTVKIARIRAVLTLKRMTDELRIANFKLKQMSLTDDLTGLRNMRGFQKQAKELIAYARKHDYYFGVIMMDLDHFKRVNDQMNHLVGSRVIATIGKLVAQLTDHKRVSRARYGGDEFIIALVGKTKEDLKKLAEKICSEVATIEFIFEEKPFQITASLGLAIDRVKESFDFESIVKKADKLLYVSKENGRGRVTSD